MMSTAIAAMRKVIKERLAPTRNSFGIKCLLRIFSLSVITGLRVASSQSCIVLFARLGIMTMIEVTLPRVMPPGRSQKRELRKSLMLTNAAEIETGTGIGTRLLLLQLLPSRKMRMKIRPQMRTRMMTPLLAALPSSTTAGSDNPARSWAHWLIKYVMV
eukprot:5223491-Ditylum_brightwellii.AAC.1